MSDGPRLRTINNNSKKKKKDMNVTGTLAFPEPPCFSSLSLLASSEALGATPQVRLGQGKCGFKASTGLDSTTFFFFFRIQCLYSTARLQELLTSYTTTLYVCSEGIGPHTAPISLTCPTTSNCLDTCMTILSICMPNQRGRGCRSRARQRLT